MEAGGEFMRGAWHEGQAGTRAIRIDLRQNAAREGRANFLHGPKGGGPLDRNFTRVRNSVTSIAMLVLAASLIGGCAPDGPLGTVGAIVTAPATAPVMFLSARMNNREDHLDGARRNDRPLCPIDAQSKEMARATLEQALERGTTDEVLHWQNDEDASRYAAGGVTVLATGRADDGRRCREVLIEIAIARRPTDQWVRTYCRDGARWSVAARTRE